MKTIDPAPHEFQANLLFDEHGLTPFFALDRAVKEGDGSQTEGILVDGERWRVALYYQDSNIVHPGASTPEGTDFQLETIREYRLSVRRHSEQDPVGEQGFTAHVAPRWNGMQGERSDGSTVEIPVPDGFGEGINIRLAGSNVGFQRYLRLLQRAMVALGIRRQYFEKPHDYSNIQDAERYVRVHKRASGPVHARDGPLAAMGHLLEHDRQGYRKIVQEDDDKRGENLPGFYHTVTLAARRLREAFPTHSHPKEIKHYYAKEALRLPADNPLAHPKVGVSLQSSLLDRDDTVHWSDLDRLQRELDQTLLSVLNEAGLNVADGPYIEDAYFEPGVSEAGPDPVGLDLTRIESDQESVVVRHLADGLSPVQWEALKTLTTDGGEVAPNDIAERHERHPDSVRRALREMEDLVHREYAKVSLKSKYIAKMVREAVDEARDAVRRAAETTAKAVEAAERGLDQTMADFIAWAERHGIDVEDSSIGEMTLRFSEGEDWGSISIWLREGERLWKEAGLPVERFRSARVVEGQGRAVSMVWEQLRV